MKLAKLIALALCAAPAAKADLGDTAWGREVHWKAPNKYEIALHVVSRAAIILDTWQSLDIKNHKAPLPEGGFSSLQMSETGPIAMIWGPNPTDLQFIGTGIAMCALTTGVWYVLPREIRWLTDVVVIGVEGPVIYRNFTKWNLKLTIPF